MRAIAPTVTLASEADFPGEADLVVLPHFADAGFPEGVASLDRAVGGRGPALRSAGSLRGEAREVRTILGEVPIVCYLGLGEARDLDLEGLRRAAGEVAGRARELGASKVAVALPTDEESGPSDALILDHARAIVDGVGIAQHRIEKLEKEPDDDDGETPLEELVLVLGPGASGDLEALEEEVAFARSVLDGVAVARDIANLAPNHGTPSGIVDRIRELAGEAGLGLEVLDADDLEELGAGGILGVAAGSDEPPYLACLDWNPDGATGTVCVIGKGVTFDSGGISIKASSKMEEMKFDKAGAAATVGILAVAAEARLPVRVVGIVALTENLPSGSAIKPSDVLEMLDGSRVEVISTDAEGRLILADALTYARRWEPDAIVDLATLTGSCVVALGHFRSGLFSTDDGLARALEKAGERTGDRVWRLPLDDEYLTYLESDFADTKNSGGRWGGAVTAARFLQRFVEDDRPWAHLDIAGTAWDAKQKEYLGQGATGAGVRVVAEWLRRRAES